MGVFEFLWRLMVLPFGSPPKLIYTDVCSAAAHYRARAAAGGLKALAACLHSLAAAGPEFA